MYIYALPLLLHIVDTPNTQRYDSQCKQKLTELKNQGEQSSASALAVHVPKHHWQLHQGQDVQFAMTIPPLPSHTCAKGFALQLFTWKNMCIAY